LIRNSSDLPIEKADPRDLTCLVSDMGMSRLIEFAESEQRTKNSVGPLKW